MRWTALAATLLFSLGILGLGCGSAPPPMFPPATTQTAPNGSVTYSNPTLDHAQSLLTSGQLDPAKVLLVAWLKGNPHAPDRDRGICLMAEYYVDAGAMIPAFYQYDELLDNLPDSPMYYLALENQYKLADVLLKGYKSKFLGLAVIDNEDEAVEMLYRIQERSPGSPLAERSMWRTAEYYYDSSQFDLAYDVYTTYIRSYPRSQLISRALLRRAFSSGAQFRDVQFDATPLLDARSQFQDIIARYPSLAAEKKIADIIDQIDRKLAQKMFDTARFYAWTGKPIAAVYTYRSLIDQYPNSTQAQAAKNELRHMPAAALAQTPMPPTTQPTDETTPTLTLPTP